MSGIVFFGTENHDEVVEFYTERLGAEIWLEQTACTILKRDNLLVGFCESDETEDCGVVTVVREDREGVDAAYDRLDDVAHGPPEENEAYDIYQFFADDPDGRSVEVQTFCHETDPI
jgi:hypothetical protein